MAALCVDGDLLDMLDAHDMPNQPASTGGDRFKYKIKYIFLMIMSNKKQSLQIQNKDMFWLCYINIIQVFEYKITKSLYFQF